MRHLLVCVKCRWTPSCPGRKSILTGELQIIKNGPGYYESVIVPCGLYIFRADTFVYSTSNAELWRCPRWMLSDECEPVSVSRDTREPMLSKVDATRQEQHYGSRLHLELRRRPEIAKRVGICHRRTLRSRPARLKQIPSDKAPHNGPVETA